MFLTNRHLDDLCGAALADLESRLERFEDAWRRGERPRPEDYLPPAGPGREAALRELVATDLEYRLRDGQPARVEDYLGRFPGLAADRAALLDLLGAEFRLRRDGAPSEYSRRFPDLGADLAARLGPRTAPGGTGADPPPAAGPRRLGRYELLEPLGSGSFGTVYRARDTELGRVVALKVPRLGGLATPVEAERFLREARSTARLRHPGIVPVHDAGRIDGVCYLVSEYVPGQTLGQRLTAGPLGPGPAAELVARVAEALDAAHREGVIHRDIKPSNILLDRDGTPRLVDFGLATAAAGDHTLTAEGEVLGTPAYMAPEQARGEAHRVDARSDVYSLGVVLYEALTGQLPFRGNSRMVLAQVLEEEPPPPRRLNDQVPRDLETVCLKALTKEPAGRYPTAAALAADLHRFLAGRPVLARPLGAAGRLGRWCRRNPLPAALAAALVLVTALGFAGVTWQWRRAAAGLAESERQRREAERSLRRVSRAWQAFADLSGNDLVRQTPRLDPLRREVRDRALEEFRQFLRQCGDDPALRRDRAHAYFMIGILQADRPDPRSQEQARAALRKALALWQDLAREQPAVAEFRRNQAPVLEQIATSLYFPAPSAAGARAWGQARDLLEQLVREQPGHPDLAMDLARFHFQLGRWQRRARRLPEALGSFRQAHALLDRVARDNPRDAYTRERLASHYNSLAALEQRAGQRREAIRSLEQARDLWERLLRESPAQARLRKGLAECYRGLGWLQQDCGLPAAARRSFRQAGDLLEWVLRDDPSRLDLQALRADLLFAAARTEDRCGRPAEAVRLFRQAAAAFERLLPFRPRPSDSRPALAACYHCLGNLSAQLGRPAEAVPCYRQALRLREALCREHPEEPAHRGDLAGTRHNLGEALGRLGRWPEALATLRSAVDLERALVKAGESPPRRLGRWYLDLARARVEAGRPAEAVAALRRYTRYGRGDPVEWYLFAREFVRCPFVAGEGRGRTRRAVYAGNPPARGE